MDVFARADIGSRPPRRACDERAAPLFTGAPPAVAGYLAERMRSHPDRVALLTAELAHLEGQGLTTDSVCFVLTDDSKVTVRP